VTTQGVNLIYSMDVAADAVGTSEIFNSNSMAGLVAALAALKK
jgi:hypothetical protein